MTRLQFPKKLLVATLGSAFLALGYAKPSIAASITYSGSTVGQPTLFSSQEFSVDADGLYEFSSSGFGSFLSLYKGSFDPTDLLANLMIENNGSQTDYEYLLAALVIYFLVTAFNDDGSSNFTNTISGPGNIALGAKPVPEPLTILGTLTAAGFGVALRRQQRQQKKAPTKV